MYPSSDLSGHGMPAGSTIDFHSSPVFMPFRRLYASTSPNRLGAVLPTSHSAIAYP
jgi:hypothetical protein